MEGQLLACMAVAKNRGCRPDRQDENGIRRGRERYGTMAPANDIIRCVWVQLICRMFDDDSSCSFGKLIICVPVSVTATRSWQTPSIFFFFCSCHFYFVRFDFIVSSVIFRSISFVVQFIFIFFFLVWLLLFLFTLRYVLFVSSAGPVRSKCSIMSPIK